MPMGCCGIFAHCCTVVYYELLACTHHIVQCLRIETHHHYHYYHYPHFLSPPLPPLPFTTITPPPPTPPPPPPQVRLLLLAALCGEHLLLLGPPGTAKSELSRRLSSLTGGRYYERLLTRFSVPEELFGPLSMRGDELFSCCGSMVYVCALYDGYILALHPLTYNILSPHPSAHIHPHTPIPTQPHPGLENDQYVRQIDGYLPTAEVAFVDEIFKANSAILNALLTLLNERLFDNGNQRFEVPLLCLVGASNELPESEELDALYDRFLIRKHVSQVWGWWVGVL